MKKKVLVKKNIFTRKRIAALLLAAVMPMSFSACGDSGTDQKGKDVTQENDTGNKADAPKTADVIAAAQKNMGDISSLDAQMVMEMDMDVTENGEKEAMQMKITTDMTYFYDPMHAKINTKMDAGAGSVLSSTLYIEGNQDGTYTMYAKSGGSGWLSQPVETDMLKQYDMAAALKSNLKEESEFKAAGTEQIDGVDTYKYEGMISGERIWETMLSSGMSELLNSLMMDTSGIEEQTEDLGELKITYWIDQNTMYPVRYEMDMAEIMDKLMKDLAGAAGETTEETAAISKMKVTVICSNYNKAEDFKIPKKAKKTIEV